MNFLFVLLKSQYYQAIKNMKFTHLQKYENCISALKRIINKSIREEKFYDVDGENGLVEELMKLLSINKYKAKSIAETILSAMSVYQRDYNNNLYSKVYMAKQLNSGNVKYKFLRGSVGFFSWIDNGFNIILEKTINEILYLIDNTGNKGFKETLLILGILETLDILVFKSLGGSNSQLYIYVNETKTMREIIDKPWRYKNRLVELISERHDISVEMLTYLFEGEFTSNKIWNYIEDYFLGIIPDPVLTTYEKKQVKN